jgi:hypothetical protein
MLSPGLYPIGIDRLRHLVSFVPMSPDRYRNSSFLDPAATRMGPDVYTFNLDDLLLYDLHVSNHRVPVHYVFHTAFCCSTLLARYLDLIPPCFVLREPGILAQIAMLRPRGNPASNLGHSASTADEGQTLLNLVMRLLTRTYASEDIVIIKVSDFCNSLGDALLKVDTRSRIVFLYVPLRTFILSVLKRQSRRVWLRRRLRDTRKVAGSFPELASVDPGRLRDAEGAAYLWLLNRALYNDLRMGEHSARVLAFDGDTVAESPKRAVAEIAAFFRLTLSEQSLSQLLAHPSVGRYSKDLSLQYDVESRRDALAEMRGRFGMEAEKGVEWACRITQRLEFEATI